MFSLLSDSANVVMLEWKSRMTENYNTANTSLHVFIKNEYSVFEYQYV